MIAALFLIPGIALLSADQPATIFHATFRSLRATPPSIVEAASAKDLHAYGVAALVISSLLVLFYFKVRRAIRRD